MTLSLGCLNYFVSNSYESACMNRQSGKNDCPPNARLLKRSMQMR